MPSTLTPAATTAPVRGMIGMRRELAALAILARPGFAPATVSTLRETIASSPWRDVLPDRYQQQAVHRALAALECRHQAQRCELGDLWELTEFGLDFAREHVIGNHNINPEAPGPEEPGDGVPGEFSIDYDIELTAASLKALAKWVAPLQDSTPVQIAVDDRMVVVAHPGGRNAFDTDGSPGSPQYVALSPLDPTGDARRSEPAPAAR